MGSYGVNAGYARALQLACQCFEWNRLLHNAPSVDDLQRFGELYGMLKPYLRHTEWPDRESFPRVQRSWPNAQVMQVQYVLLLNRLRQARRKRPAMWRSWWTPVGFRVIVLHSFRSVQWFVEKVFPSINIPDVDYVSSAHEVVAIKRALSCKISALISSFVAETRGKVSGNGGQRQAARKKTHIAMAQEV